MKFTCPRCGGNTFYLHKLPDHDSMAQCIACGKAVIFEQSAPAATAAGPETSGASESAKRSKLHLPERT